MCRERRRAEPRTPETFFPDFVDRGLRSGLLTLVGLMKRSGGRESVKEKRQTGVWVITAKDKFGGEVRFRVYSRYEDEVSEAIQRPTWGFDIGFREDEREYHYELDQFGNIVHINDDLDPPEGVTRLFRFGQGNYVCNRADESFKPIPLKRCLPPRAPEFVVKTFLSHFE